MTARAEQATPDATNRTKMMTRELLVHQCLSPFAIVLRGSAVMSMPFCLLLTTSHMDHC
jgi:hypothetical protein